MSFSGLKFVFPFPWQRMTNLKNKLWKCCFLMNMNIVSKFHENLRHSVATPLCKFSGGYMELVLIIKTNIWELLVELFVMLHTVQKHAFNSWQILWERDMWYGTYEYDVALYTARLMRLYSRKKMGQCSFQIRLCRFTGWRLKIYWRHMSEDMFSEKLVTKHIEV